MGWLGLKELRRAIALEAWGNRYAVREGTRGDIESI